MIPLAIVWAGYTLVWYGFSNLKDWNIGLTDLIKPSQVSKVQTAMNSPQAGTNQTPSSSGKSSGGGGLKIPLFPALPGGSKGPSITI